MAEEDTPQEEKTEEPTARRLEKAKEEGQVLRSQDMTIAAVTISVIATLYMAGFWMGPRFQDLFARALTFRSEVVFDKGMMFGWLASITLDGFLTLVPMMFIAVLMAIGSASLLGGFVITLKSIEPKASKLNPIKGLGRIFGLRAIVELTKALLKFSLVATFAGTFLYFNFENFVRIGGSEVLVGIESGIELVLLGALVTCTALLVIAAIDIPYQQYEFIKKLKMTKKEIKDEMKDIEGQPEVRQKIRQKQKDLASQRMLEEVPSADVVITNPQHFAVALLYEVSKDEAPKVVAKGKNLIAQKIKDRAAESDIEIFESPLLARALYFTTEIGGFIPPGLFFAVAQVIAYVYNLNSLNPSMEAPARPRPKVPKELIFDELGQQQASQARSF
jgi:flagellar biosynthetic protein FlhB